MVSFYVSWFSRVYQCQEGGWSAICTPDNRSIARQDAFFWFALEIIAQELNVMRAIEMARLTDR